MRCDYKTDLKVQVNLSPDVTEVTDFTESKFKNSSSCFISHQWLNQWLYIRVLNLSKTEMFSVTLFLLELLSCDLEMDEFKQLFLLKFDFSQSDYTAQT